MMGKDCRRESRSKVGSKARREGTGRDDVQREAFCFQFFKIPTSNPWFFPRRCFRLPIISRIIYTNADGWILGSWSWILNLERLIDCFVRRPWFDGLDWLSFYAKNIIIGPKERETLAPWRVRNRPIWFLHDLMIRQLNLHYIFKTFDDFLVFCLWSCFLKCWKDIIWLYSYKYPLAVLFCTTTE